MHNSQLIPTEIDILFQRRFTICRNEYNAPKSTHKEDSADEEWFKCTIPFVYECIVNVSLKKTHMIQFFTWKWTIFWFV